MPELFRVTNESGRFFDDVHPIPREGNKRRKPGKPNGHAPDYPESSGLIVENPGRPTIRVLAGLRHRAADEALEAMHKAGVGFYQRDRQLVRCASMKAKTSDGNAIEVPVILPVTAAVLGRVMGCVAEWEKVKADGTPIRIDPPKEVVEQVAGMAGEWPFPPLTGVIATPTMRPDGTILDRIGYDPPTGLVLISPPPMPAVSPMPTRHHAEDALDLLCELLVEFPFASDVSRSVALSMILSAVLRGAIPNVPMHVATAPQPGTGKSYLFDIASTIATGERCAVISIAPNPEETEKRLIGAALSGQQIISIDNVSDMMMGDFLNQVTERPLLQLRPLGTSIPVRVANTFTVFANGNNLSAPADLVRRTLVARLDADVENPEERVFDGDPVRAVLADRGKYVAACLTIGRAYVSAGYPSPVRPLASFEGWSNLIRSALVWLKMPDPCASMDLARAEDPIRAAKAAVFHAWQAAIGLEGLGHAVSEIVEIADQFDEHGFVYPTFREACMSVAADRAKAKISPVRLGKWLTSVENNRISDLKLVVNRANPGRPKWIMTRR